MRRRHTLLLTACLALLAQTTTPASDSSPANVVLVTVPSLRADRIGVAGHTRGLTPAIDKLAAAGTLIASARTPAPATEAALASVFTGRTPRHHRLLGPTAEGPRLPTLAERLRRAGLETLAVLSDDELLRIETFASGFDIVHVGPDESATQLASRALAALSHRGDADRGFFLWLHLQDCVAPYRPDLMDLLDLMADGAHDAWRFPLDLAGKSRQRDALPRASANGPMRRVDFYLDAYDATVRQIDRAIGKLHGGLEATGAAESTLLVVAGLHGESLGEHGFWFTHGHTLYEEELRVPMLFLGPGIGTHVELENALSLTDIAPTVQGFFDLPRQIAEGEDLSVRLKKGRFSSSRLFDSVLLEEPFSRSLLVERRFKLILQPPRPPRLPGPTWWPQEERRELYDLVLDPLEAAPAQNQRRTIANEIRLLIRDRYPPVPGTPPAEDRSRRR